MIQTAVLTAFETAAPRTITAVVVALPGATSVITQTLAPTQPPITTQPTVVSTQPIVVSTQPIIVSSLTPVAPTQSPISSEQPTPSPTQSAVVTTQLPGSSTSGIVGTQLLPNTPSQSPTNSPPVVVASTNDLGVKIGAGVGVPVGLALIGALLFFIFRRRKANAAVQSDNLQPEGFLQNDPKSPTTSSRPISELPPYTAASVAAAGIVRKPVGSPTSTNPTSPLVGSNLPERNYGVQGYGQYSPTQGGYAPVPQAYGVPGYGTPGYHGMEAETVANRHEMGSPIHEMHELPSHYGP